MLMQGCKVYHSKTATVDEAILTQKRVKVKTDNGDTYKYDKIQKEDNKLYGIVKWESRNAKKLSKQMVEGILIGEYVKYPLKENTIKEYHLQNETLAWLLPIVIPISLIGITLGVWWLTSDSKVLIGIY